MIHIENLNESRVRIRCEYGILLELFDRFSFLVEGYKFMPKYKAGIWDGYIRLINRKDSTAPKGIVPDIIDYAQSAGYKVTFEKGFIDPFIEDISADINFPVPFQPRDYQLAAVKRCLEKKRQIILSATGSGKSFSLYLLCRLLRNHYPAKILLLVPNVSLVRQMYDDFYNYAKPDKTWDAEENVHMIYSGKDKHSDSAIYISTWQSLYKLPPAYFKDFDVVIGDEIHLFKSTATSAIFDKCVNAFCRYGFTGTLDDSQTNEMMLKGLIGPVHRVSSTKDLIERDLLANLSIKALVLKHTTKTHPQKVPASIKYKDEIDILIGTKRRNNFIANLSCNIKGNTLVMFQMVEKHGKPLVKMIEKKAKKYGKRVHFVYGGVDAEAREQIRKIAESSTDNIIVCSYGTYSTGVNIVNVDNIIFASPTKSKIRVLQSIGRGLRRSGDKEHCTLYDLADDLSFGRKKKNHTLGHFLNRYEIYMREGFDVKLMEVPL